MLADGIRFGKGLQLVNILRDLPADLKNGRCYLPMEELAEVGLAPEDLLQPANECKLRPLYNHYLDVAESHLAAGWNYTNTHSARTNARAAGVRVAGFDRRKNDFTPARGRYFEPTAAHENHARRGSRDYFAFGFEPSISGRMAKTFCSGRKSSCIGREVGVKMRLCNFPSSCRWSARLFFAPVLSHVHAQDNPAQAAARAALDAKMRALDAQPVSPNMTAPPTVADTAAQAKAMEALQERMSELDAQQKAETTAASSSDNAAQTAARAALEKKLHELTTQQAAMNVAKPAAAPPVQSPVVATPPANANYPGKELGLPPITAPPLPISAQQETDLQGLLMRYEANQISPEEYQKQRAAILAGPVARPIERLFFRARRIARSGGFFISGT